MIENYFQTEQGEAAADIMKHVIENVSDGSSSQKFSVNLNGNQLKQFSFQALDQSSYEDLVMSAASGGKIGKRRVQRSQEGIQQPSQRLVIESNQSQMQSSSSSSGIESQMYQVRGVRQGDNSDHSNMRQQKFIRNTINTPKSLQTNQSSSNQVLNIDFSPNSQHLFESQQIQLQSTNNTPVTSLNSPQSFDDNFNLTSTPIPISNGSSQHYSLVLSPQSIGSQQRTNLTKQLNQLNNNNDKQSSTSSSNQNIIQPNYFNGLDGHIPLPRIFQKFPIIEQHMIGFETWDKEILKKKKIELKQIWHTRYKDLSELEIQALTEQNRIRNNEQTHSKDMFPWKFKQKARQIQQTQKEESLQVNINEKEKDNNQIINNKEKEQKEIIDSSQQIEEQNLRDSCDEALLDEFDQNESNDGSEEENNLNLEKEKKEHNDKGAQKIENIENKIMLVNQLFEDEVISILLRTAMDRMIKPFLVGNRWEWISMYKPSSSRRKPLNYPQVSVSSILQYTNENTTKVCLHHLFARALGDGSLIPKGCQVSHLYPNIRILAVIVESREKNELRKQCHKNKLGEGSLVTAMQCQHLDTTLCRTIPDNFIFPKPNAEETEKQN